MLSSKQSVSSNHAEPSNMGLQLCAPPQSTTQLQVTTGFNGHLYAVSVDCADSRAKGLRVFTQICRSGARLGCKAAVELSAAQLWCVFCASGKVPF